MAGKSTLRTEAGDAVAQRIENGEGLAAQRRRERRRRQAEDGAGRQQMLQAAAHFLAHEIGQKLGTGAVSQELKRTAIGDFKLTEAVNLSQVTKENWSDFLIKPAEALQIINRQYLKNNF